MYCDRCGKRIRSADATEVANGDNVCLECLHEYYQECGNCMEIHDKEDMYETEDGDMVCESCRDEYYSYCNDCGNLVLNDDLTRVDDGQGYVCNSCLDDNYYQCEWCDGYFSQSNVYTTYDGHYVCQECGDSHYYRCEDCGDMVSEDEYVYREHEDAYYCPNCDPGESEAIYDYHAFDDFRKYRTPADDYSTPTFGFELEVSGDRGYAEDFLEFFDGEVILMNDSSIIDGGFEIITMPMTTNYFYETFLEKFKKGLEFLNNHGFSGHNKGGLHIHISPPSSAVLAQLAHMIYGCNDNEIKVWKQLTQRREEDLHWCRFDTEPENFECILNRRYPDCLTRYRDRYVAINYDSRTETYEFRIFNSNTRIERFLKNFEIVLSLLEYCKKYDRATIAFASLKEYLKFVDDNKLFYQNLYAFIQEKNIKYIGVQKRQVQVANGEPVVYEVPGIDELDVEIPY